MKRKKDTTPSVPVVGAQTDEWSAVAGFSIPISVPIPVELIDPNPEQPRINFDETELKALADNIQRRGLIQPIVVQPNGDRYTLHDGERRWRAHKLAGLTEVQAYIVPPGADPKELLLRAIAANDQRADLTAIERAKSYQKLHDDYGMSDAAIAKEVGKSRSVVANLRRLLQLPEDRQAQVAKGTLNERQALALLPLYQLPEATRNAILNSWQAKELATPEKYTSDRIRDMVNLGLNAVSKDITLIDPDAAFEAEGVYRPTCTGCDFLVKKTNDNSETLRCINQPCLKAKQVVFIRAYLEQASVATGLPYTDPAANFEWHETDGFFGTMGEKALQYALDSCCQKLYLKYSEHMGRGPEGFYNAHYTCVHPGQRSCACAKTIEAQEKQAEKARHAEMNQLCAQVKAHLVAIIQATPAIVLRVTLYTERRYESHQKKCLDMSPEKLAAELADFWIGHNLIFNPARSIESTRAGIDDWLAKMGLPPLEPPATDPLPDLDRRLSRIEGWLTAHEERPPAEQIKTINGNLTNLAQLAEEIYKIDDYTTDEDDLQSLLKRLDAAKHTLLIWREQVEALALTETLNTIEARLDAPPRSLSGILDEIEARLAKKTDLLRNETIYGTVEERGETHTDMNQNTNGTGTSLNDLLQVEESIIEIEDWLIEHGPNATGDELRRHCSLLDGLGETVGRYEARWRAIPLSRELAERINTAGCLAQEFIAKRSQPEEVAA